jgi:hypothetical protein
MATSETVQTAQRLLADREAVGLRKYGTTVDRTDLSPAQWAQHLLEELSDAVLYLIRLKAEIAELEENAREMAAGQCVHPLGIMGGAHGHALCRLNGKGHGSLEYWDVDRQEVLANLPALREVMDKLPNLFDATGAATFDELIDKLRSERQRAPAAAPEDAERAAYLARWDGAPEWAQWLSESEHGVCKWHKRKPELVMGAWTAGEQSMQDAHDLLGSVRCEPRPTPADGQGVEG